MKTILLVCSAGMSTSLLVTKMEAAAKDAGV
ncbi:MAG: PTS sugar transporter subunit IIB, partial [Coprobacillus cateniformis]